MIVCCIIAFSTHGNNFNLQNLMLPEWKHWIRRNFELLTWTQFSWVYENSQVLQNGVSTKVYYAPCRWSMDSNIRVVTDLKILKRVTFQNKEYSIENFPRFSHLTFYFSKINQENELILKNFKNVCANFFKIDITFQ